MPRSTKQALLLLSLLLLGLSCVVVLSEGFSLPQNIHKQQRHHRLYRTTTTTSTTATATTGITTSRSLSSPLTTTTAFTSTRGGASSSSSSSSTMLLFAADPNESKCPVSGPLSVFGALWGSLGVVYILLKAVKRVLPIALEPFGAESALVLTPMQWGFYGLSCLFFAYAEGYKGFQRKFSPLVVKRSFSLVIGTRQGNSVLNFVLAPLYSMGLMHATRKRLITSWSVSLGVATIVAVVKKLPPVWRCILDAGVVVGLSYGSLSILILFFNAWRTGKAPAVDACLPLEKKTAASTASVEKKKK